MKTVFLFIPNYVYSSDLLRTEYIKYLSGKYRVIVFLPPFIFQNLPQHNYYRNPNIVYAEWRMRNERLLGLFKLLRVSCVKQFDQLTSVQLNYKFFFGDWKRKFLRKISSFLPMVLTVDFFSGLEKLFLYCPGLFLKYCKSYHPVLVLTATPGLTTFEAEIIAFAKRAKIHTVAVDFSWDNLTSNSKHIRKTDYLIAWNEIIKNEAVRLHNYPEDRIFVSGILRFDHNFKEEQSKISRKEFLLSKNLNPDKKTILFSTVTQGCHPLQKEFVRDLIRIRDKKIAGQPNIFIRLHPKDRYENYTEFLNAKNLHIERAGRQFCSPLYGSGRIEMNEDDLTNLKYTLLYTDININCFSSISLEACVFDKPIINVSSEKYLGFFSGFEHYKPIVEQSAAKVADSLDKLTEYINFYLENPNSDSENRKIIARKFVPFSDSLSYKRNVDFLDEIICAA